MIDRWPLRRSFTLAVVALFFLAAPAAAQAPKGPSRAAPINVFEVAGVAVDVTADTAAAAREKALADGEKAAFRRLLERLTLREDHGRLPDVPRAQLAPYVQDLSVADEKTSAVRYLARLTYRFKPEAVRTLLRDHGIPFAETPSKPVLVLPVYQAAGALLLWDDPNPWREAWAKRPTVDGLVPLTLPLGDLPDVAAIGAEQAAAGDAARLTAIANRYDTTDTLVLKAVLAIDPGTGRPGLRVTVARHSGTRDAAPTELAFPAAPDEATPALLARAAQEVARRVEDRWKRDTLLQSATPAVAAVTVPIGGLNDWLEVRRRLSTVAVVRRTDLVLLSKTEARINLHYIGEPEQLVLALQQADLDLVQEGGAWTLTVTRRPPKS
jgi:hypothetical protein